MLVLVRWFGRLFKKEFRILSRYERSHPHFIWYICLDAVVSVLLVVGGFQLYSHVNSTSPSEELLERSGGIGMTESKFIDVVKYNNATVYWLGPQFGATYSLNRSQKYANIVTYIVQGSSINDTSQPRLTVETYTSSTTLEQRDRIIASATSRKVVTKDGSTVEYDVNSLTSMTINPQGVPQMVVVEYPGKQSAEKLLQDAEKLALVK